MRRLLSLAVIFLALGAAAPCSSADDRAAQIVQQMAPESLREKDQTLAILSDYVTLTLGDAPRIVAAYTNGFVGSVMVIDPSEPPSVVSEFAPRGMGGTTVSVSALNLIPGAPDEVVVSFGGAKGGTLDWMLSATRDSVTMIGPQHRTADQIFPAIVDARFLDLDSDGALEVIGSYPAIAEDPDDAPHLIVEAVRFAPDGSYTLSEGFHYGEYFRGREKPEVETDTFTALPADAELVVRNGFDDVPASTSGWIKLNGDMIVTPAAFQKGSRVSRVPVRLQESNELQVELAGKPGSGIAVFIEKTPH